jgi:hypothetical protein
MKKQYFSHLIFFCQVAKFSLKSKIPASWQMVDFFGMHHYNGDSQALKRVKFHKKEKIPSINNHLKMANV